MDTDDPRPRSRPRLRLARETDPPAPGTVLVNGSVRVRIERSGGTMSFRALLGPRPVPGEQDPLRALVDPQRNDEAHPREDEHGDHDDSGDGPDDDR